MQAAGRSTLLAAESSSVLSRTFCAAFEKATAGSAETSRASEHILAASTGFHLNGMALEPTCRFSIGSDISPEAGDCMTLRSSPNLWQLWAMEAREARIT